MDNKMKKKLSAGILVFLAALMLSGFWGCSGDISADDYVDTFLGGMLKVDAQGHFKEDILYTPSARVTYELNADGSWKYSSMSYEDAGENIDGDDTLGEGWVLSYYYGGTYTWDPDTFKYEEITTYVDWWPGDDEEQQDEYYVNTAWRYFREHEYGNIYSANDTSWVQEDSGIYYNPDDHSELQNSYSNTTTITITADHITRHSTSMYANGTDSHEYYNSEWEADIEYTTPDETVWEKGNIVTFHCLETLVRNRNWDWNNDQFLGWEEYSLGGATSTYVHMGEYMLDYTDSSSSRSLFDNEIMKYKNK